VDSHYLNRILDLVFDQRMPHNLIPTMLRTRKLRRMISQAEPLGRGQLLVALTFDVEREYGSDRVKGNSATASQFLASLQDAPENVTIFVEGSLVEENSEALRSLQWKGIEIGLHGYRHELWGRPQWYLRDRPLRPDQREALIEAGIEAFRKAGLRRPVVFRSPNLVADTSTLRLLLENRFRVDSSLPSHRGVLPAPQFFGGPEGLIRVPVTADPMPSLSCKAVLPYCTYRACNLRNLKEMRKEELLQRVSRIGTLQEVLGFQPHIVILCHSWEFLSPRINHRDYSYCSPANFEFLRNLNQTLSDRFSVRHVSMSTLAEQFNQKMRSPSFHGSVE
jgi:peptidoglycan/xylan/chitin deacetylase (PgdA/CDA1 family)